MNVAAFSNVSDRVSAYNKTKWKTKYIVITWGCDGAVHIEMKFYPKPAATTSNHEYNTFV